MNYTNTSALTAGAAMAHNMRPTLVQAVHYGLLALGEIPRQVIYNRIRSSYGIGPEEIPEKLESFQRALRELLGTSAKVMEKLIAKNFYSRLGLNFKEHKDWTLVDYVSHTTRPDRSPSFDSSRIAPIVSPTCCRVTTETSCPGTRDRFESGGTRISDLVPVALRKRAGTPTSLTYNFPTMTAWLWRGPR